MFFVAQKLDKIIAHLFGFKAELVELISWLPGIVSRVDFYGQDKYY